MRIPEKYQDLYFYLQEAENKLITLDHKNDILKENKEEIDYIDKEGISITRDINRMLKDLKEFGPYNDMEAIWAVTASEIKNNITNRINNLEKLIYEKEKNK